MQKKKTSYNTTHNFFTYIITLVWLANGLFCKVLNFVPRHEQIVGRILNNDYSRFLTVSIGVLEIVMAVWIISRIRARLNVIIQIVIIASMNILEFFLVPDLLLWGKANIIFAAFFIILIYYNEFILNKKLTQRI